jgi:hypothetical protein
MKGLDRLLHKTAPVPGFVEGLKALHAMGHPIHIVTARSPASHDDIVAWLGELGITVGTGEEDTIAALWFTDTYGGTKPELGERGSTESAIEREEKLNEQLKEVWREGVGKGKGGKSKLRESVFSLRFWLFALLCFALLCFALLCFALPIPWGPS